MGAFKSEADKSVRFTGAWGGTRYNRGVPFRFPSCLVPATLPA
jgi:hypothetical protein